MYTLFSRCAHRLGFFVGADGLVVRLKLVSTTENNQCQLDPYGTGHEKIILNETAPLKGEEAFGNVEIIEIFHSSTMVIDTFKTHCRLYKCHYFRMVSYFD